MIVIDVGAMHHPPEESTYFLADYFNPLAVYAFDGLFDKSNEEEYGETWIFRRAEAAWVHDQGMPYRDRGMCSSVTDEGEKVVPTFDLAEFIDTYRKPNDEIILKLDCEGAEYVLIPHLIETGAIHHVSTLLLEVHPPHLANGWYVPPSERPALPPELEVGDWNDLTQLPTEAEKVW